MVHNPSSEANQFSASQEIPRISWNLKVHYHIYKCPTPVPYPEPDRSSPWPTIAYYHLRLELPSDLFPSGFPTKTLYTPLLSPIHASCPANLILIDLITRTILAEGYRSLTSSICIFLHSPVTSSLLDTNILLSTAPYSSTSSAYVPPQCEQPSFTPIQNNGQNYSSVYLNP